MLNSRFMVVFLAAFAVCGLLTILQARNDAEAARSRHDAFGTNYYGWRGVHDTMGRLGLPVTRGIAPPTANAPRDRVWVFWEPSSALTAASPMHAEALRRWVEAGGRAVVAPVRRELASMHGMDDASDDPVPDFLLKTLLPSGHVNASLRHPQKTWRPASGDRHDQSHAFAANVDAQAHLMEVFQSSREYALRGSGRFEKMAGDATRVTLPQNLQRLVLPHAPAAVLEAVDGDERLPIAAEFPVGQGAVTVVGDPSLIYNTFLGRPGNAALAVALLRDPGKTTCFDEFYHGHAARGSVARLFLAPPYALALTALALLLGLVAWRHGVGFGPPLAAEGAPRRTVLEHIAALTWMLRRGRTRRFILRGLLDGALWQCRHRDGGGMAVGAADIDAVAARIAHREPERAARFAAAARRCAELAASPEPPGTRQALAAARGLLRETFPPQ